jgi:hypothetical protein
MEKAKVVQEAHLNVSSLYTRTNTIKEARGKEFLKESVYRKRLTNYAIYKYKIWS